MPPTEEKIMSEIRICKYCSSEFTPIRSTQVCCCRRCRSRLNLARHQESNGKEVVKKQCPKCGKTFMTVGSKRKLCPDCDAVKRKEKKLSNNKKIDLISKLARESGMSYGKYVAMQSMKPLERK